MLARTQPDSTLMVLLSASTSSTRFMRARQRTISAPLACGTAAPHIPVFPPCGTIAVRVSAQIPTTAATSAALPGLTTAGVAPR
jgi:hypothetical protein